MTFTSPNALFPTTISELSILPQHALKDVPPEQMKTSDYWKTKQIGTGPFMWSKYTPGQSIELLPFANYWRGAPKLGKLIRREFQDTAAALLAFDNGEVDFTYLTADAVDHEKSNPNAVVLPGASGRRQCHRVQPEPASRVQEPEVPAGAGSRDRRAVDHPEPLRRRRTHPGALPLQPVASDRQRAGLSRTTRRPRRSSSRNPASTSPSSARST